VLLGERLGAAQIAGGVIVLAGALLAQTATVRLGSAHHTAEATETVRV
jgi:drug/metabolite transporter (DMT)-like permease